jgi:prophage regulatory protein
MLRFIRLKEVMALTGLSRSSIYAFINDGKFPAQVRLAERTVAWVESEICDWMKQKIADRRS